jgi:fatty acid desaturase
MLNELHAQFPGALPAILGVSARAVWFWRAGEIPPYMARPVWLCWVVLLHPERLQTLLDVLTWGRFTDARTPPVVSEGISGGDSASKPGNVP